MAAGREVNVFFFKFNFLPCVGKAVSPPAASELGGGGLHCLFQYLTKACLLRRSFLAVVFLRSGEVLQRLLRLNLKPHGVRGLWEFSQVEDLLLRVGERLGRSKEQMAPFVSRQGLANARLLTSLAERAFEEPRVLRRGGACLCACCVRGRSSVAAEL